MRWMSSSGCRWSAFMHQILIAQNAIFVRRNWITVDGTNGMTYSKWYTICSAFYHTFYACIIHNVDRSSASDYVYTRVCTSYYIIFYYYFVALSIISASVSAPLSILPIAAELEKMPEILHVLCIDCSAAWQNLARILQMQVPSIRMDRRISRFRDFRQIHRPLPTHFQCSWLPTVCARRSCDIFPFYQFHFVTTWFTLTFDWSSI